VPSRAALLTTSPSYRSALIINGGAVPSRAALLYYLLYTVHSTQYIVHSTQYTVHSTQYTVHSTQYTVHRTRYTVHGTQYTVHSTRYTVHGTQYTMVGRRSRKAVNSPRARGCAIAG